MARRRNRREGRTTQLTTSLIFFMIGMVISLGGFAWLTFSLGGFIQIFGWLALGMLALIAWRWTVQLVQLRKGKWGSK
jgi:amino acid permease